MKCNQSKLICVAALVASLSISASVLAQTTLEEVVVTAQKREQSLQDVPISISVVTGDQMLEQGFSDLRDVSEFMPNVSITQGLNAKVNIRGIATGANNVAFEQSVATFIDGVYRGRAAAVSNGLMFDVDRIEVLKGPQPTFFGQNAIAGAVSIHTATPNLEEGEGHASATIGFDGDQQIELAYGFPISDTFGLRLALRDDVQDNHLSNVADPQLIDTESSAGRLTALWEPSDIFSAVFRYEVAERKQSSPLQNVGCDLAADQAAQPIASPCAQALLNDPNVTDDALDNLVSQGGSVPGPNLGTYTSLNLSQLPFMSLTQRPTDVDTASLELNWEIGAHTLTTITGYFDLTESRPLDLDYTGYALGSASNFQNTEQVSQELRFTSEYDGNIQWMTGLYWQDSRITYDNTLVTAFAMTSGQMFPPLNYLAYQESADWISAFGSLDWGVTDDFSLQLGLRYSDIEKFGRVENAARALLDTDNDGLFDDISEPDFHDPVCDGGFPPGMAAPGRLACFETPYTDDATDLSVTASYFVRDNTTLYAKYSEGFKAGGIVVGMSVVTSIDRLLYDPEDAGGFEIGVKSTSLDGRLRLNAALFGTDYTNQQVNVFDATTVTFIIGNAGASVSEGLEIDATFAATNSLQLFASLGILSAEFEDYIASCSNGDRLAGNPGIIVAPDGTSTPGTCGIDTQAKDYAGSQLPIAPDWTASFGFDFQREIFGGLLLLMDGNSFFSDEYFSTDDLDPRSLEDGYKLVNLSIGLASPEYTWSISLYGRNITDNQRVINHGPTASNQQAAGYAVTYSRGANYGVSGRWNF